MHAAVTVTGDEHLVGAQLGRAVKIDGVGRLVGAEGDDAFDIVVDGAVDDVLGAEDVGFDELKRVVLGGRHLLERGGVDDEIDALHRAFEARQVAHVAEEEAELCLLLGREVAFHLELFEFIPAVHDDRRRGRVRENCAREFPAERTGAARDQHAAILQIVHGFKCEHDDS